MKPRLALLALSLALSTAGARDPNNSPNPVSVAPGSLALEVFFPPTDQRHREFADVQKYLLNKSSPAFPLISGAVIRVEWSDFDLGDARTGAHTRYDFKIIDEEIGSWISAGKSVNFVLHTTPYGGSHCPRFGSGSNGAQDIGNCAMPPWMWTALGSSNYTDCGGQVPNYLSREFQTNYQAAIKALIEHYASNSSVGYVRIGLGKGGEINLPGGWSDPATPCGEAYTKRWGYTVGNSEKYTWNSYLKKMLEFEGTLNSSKQLMVSITPVRAPGVPPEAVSHFIAPIAVKEGIGLGHQGLSDQSVQNCKGMQIDWCELFARFSGKVPLESQTLGPSCPRGVGQCGDCPRGAQCGRVWITNTTGPLPPLIPFAIKNHATILEIYCEDWLIAFNPNHPENRRTGAAYAEAIKQAAQAR
jgi:hypothetical protein